MKTLFLSKKREFWYLFFSDFDHFLKLPKVVTLTKKSQRVLDKVVKKTKEEILKHTKENSVGEIQKKIEKIFVVLQKTKKEVVLQIIRGLVRGEGAEEMLRILMSEIHKFCFEKDEEFAIDLAIEITQCLSAKNCEVILTPEIQKLFDAKILSKCVITGMEIVDGEVQMTNKFIIGTSEEGKTIAFEFNEKGRIIIIPPDSLPSF